MRHKHEHNFVEHIGIRVFDGRATAWVPAYAVTVHPGHALKAPRMLRCTGCSEQGYEIRTPR